MEGNWEKFRIKHPPRFDHRLTTALGCCLVFGLFLLLPAVGAAQVFWSVSDDEGRQNWILGTIHSEDPRLLEWPEALVQALVEADRLALELAPDAAMLDRMEQAMRYQDARLEAVLGAQLYSQVVDVLGNHYGLAESAVERLRPWAVAMTLATPPAETGMFMDLMLSVRARGAGTEVLALETLDEQIDFLADLPRSEQIELIRHALARRSLQGEDFEAILSAYLAGDLERLVEVADRQLSGLSRGIVMHFKEIGLERRNRVMLERARPWLEEGGLIIAVGALHLPGEAGLLSLLRESGWRVEPVY
ncbi:MAG: TraB/GumN family protein [Gammaproteobacteria bacterium]|nr:TraB/GumN family protein [Gammaproteobacteria bacterium]